MRFLLVEPTPTCIDRYQVNSDSGKSYHIYVTSDSSESCDCPDHMYRKRKLKLRCKHLIAFQDFKKHQQEQEARIAEINFTL